MEQARSLIQSSCTGAPATIQRLGAPLDARLDPARALVAKIRPPRTPRASAGNDHEKFTQLEKYHACNTERIADGRQYEESITTVIQIT